MPKLRLDLEALAVETFATEAGDGRRGTVRGRRTTASPTRRWRTPGARPRA